MHASLRPLQARPVGYAELGRTSPRHERRAGQSLSRFLDSANDGKIGIQSLSAACVSFCRYRRSLAAHETIMWPEVAQQTAVQGTYSKSLAAQWDDNLAHAVNLEASLGPCRFLFG